MSHKKIVSHKKAHNSQKSIYVVLTSAKGAEYNSQGQVPGEARHVAPGKKIRMSVKL